MITKMYFGLKGLLPYYNQRCLQKCFYGRFHSGALSQTLPKGYHTVDGQKIQRHQRRLRGL